MKDVDPFKAFDRLNAALEGLGGLMAEEYERATADDPGLAQVVRHARELDPSTGWLDVAAARECGPMSLTADTD